MLKAFENGTGPGLRGRKFCPQGCVENVEIVERGKSLHRPVENSLWKVENFVET